MGIKNKIAITDVFTGYHIDIRIILHAINFRRIVLKLQGIVLIIHIFIKQRNHTCIPYKTSDYKIVQVNIYSSNNNGKCVDLFWKKIFIRNP